MQSIWCEYLLIMGAHRTQLITRTKHAYMHLVAVSKKKIKVGHGIYIALFFFAYIECLMLYLSVILCLLSSAFGLGSIVKEAMGLWDKVSKTPVNEPCNDIERLKCLDFLLKWRGIEIDGDCEKPLVNAGLILLKICFQCITNV
jgi:hypothetical protein